MVNFLHRTSSHKVYEIILQEQKSDVSLISEKLINLGHKRKQSDVRGMVTILEHFGLLEKKNQEQSKILIQGDYQNPSNELVHIANLYVDELMERGLLLRPFLEAVQTHPNSNRLIQYETVNRSKHYGYYDQRIGDDISAAMRNFTSMLGLTKPYTKRGIYELTPLGEEVVATEKKEYLMRTCDAGEPCREVCPTGAIGPYKLNPNCIACGLCVQACPYGALSLDCDQTPQLQFNPEICKQSLGTPNSPKMCDFGKVTAEEFCLQRWIKQVLKLVGITSEIPGVGEYPDLVTLEEPAFIEVKRQRVTTKRKDSLKEQILRYSQPKIIINTIEQLKRFSDIKWKEPERLILISPEGGKERELIKEIKNEEADMDFYFLPIGNISSICKDIFNSYKDIKHAKTLSDLV